MLNQFESMCWRFFHLFVSEIVKFDLKTVIRGTHHHLQCPAGVKQMTISDVMPQVFNSYKESWAVDAYLWWLVRC